MQFDERINVASCATLIGFIRYVHECSIKKEMLLCEELLTTAKGADIFNKVDGFLRKAGLDWSKVSQVSVDGAQCMMGQGKGFHSFLKEKSQNIKVVQCHSLVCLGFMRPARVHKGRFGWHVNCQIKKFGQSHIQRALWRNVSSLWKSTVSYWSLLAVMWESPCSCCWTLWSASYIFCKRKDNPLWICLTMNYGSHVCANLCTISYIVCFPW